MYEIFSLIICNLCHYVETVTTEANPSLEIEVLSFIISVFIIIFGCIKYIEHPDFICNSCKCYFFRHIDLPLQSVKHYVQIYCQCDCL